MRYDKFTTKFQQALSEAQSLAVGNDQQFIEPQHRGRPLVSLRRRRRDLRAHQQPRHLASARLVLLDHQPDPTDIDGVWFPQVGMLYSADGGKTLAQIDGFAHGDHHDLCGSTRTIRSG